MFFILLPKMRNLFILVLLLLGAIRNQTIGQTYLNTTARWTQTQTWTGFTANSQCTTVYYIEGDSLIEDTSYYKIYSDVICYLNQTEYDSLGNAYQVTDTSMSNSFNMLLREFDRKFIRRVGNQETVLYNFGINDFTSIADAVLNPVCGQSSPSLLTHDSVCIGNSLRKRWLISPSQYPLANFFIEGVGPSSGFNAPICRNGCPECSFTLNYFELNGDTLYSGNCLLLNTEFRKEEKLLLSLTGDMIRFSSKTVKVIELFTLQGSLIAMAEANNGVVTMPLNQFENGIYLYRAFDQGDIISGKFIVAR